MPGHKYPKAIEEIIEILKTLPGVGRRSAERMAFSMLKWDTDKLDILGTHLKTLHEKIGPCPECGNLAASGELCNICAMPSRDKTLVCVVEEASQVQNIENSSFFKGVYHVLGGKLSPLEGKNAKDLKLDELFERIKRHNTREIILALSPDVEGQATAIYIADMLKENKLKITRLAQGLPAGSDISYADSATIAAALNGRIPL
ncbi:MAG: recombination protein RecR [Lentisphaerae bacterium GWF2_44_16]|nr:MAG: recombination protein RecR [Lentisphaerae bacterium GWF2_44_16]